MYKWSASHQLTYYMNENFRRGHTGIQHCKHRPTHALNYINGSNDVAVKAQPSSQGSFSLLKGGTGRDVGRTNDRGPTSNVFTTDAYVKSLSKRKLRIADEVAVVGNHGTTRLRLLRRCRLFHWKKKTQPGKISQSLHALIIARKTKGYSL